MSELTSLSVGLYVNEVLTEELGSLVTDVFPVATTDVELPYIIYRRAHFDQTSTKDGGAAGVAVEVACLAQSYAESVQLAEKVRQALDHTSGRTDDGLVVRSCVLVDAEESWDSGAFIQTLTFNIKC